MEIEVILKPSKEWMGNFAKQFGSEAQSPNEFHYADSQSHFRLNSMRFDKETVIMVGDINWSGPLNTRKVPLNTNEYWTLVLITSEDKHTNYLWKDKDKKEIQLKRSILLYSSKTVVDTHWPVGKQSRFVSISFHRDWLQEKLSLRSTNILGMGSTRLNTLLLSESAEYIEGMVSVENSILMDKLFEETNALTWKLSAQAQCYNLLVDFVNQLGKESVSEPQRMNSYDRKRIMAVENQYFEPLKPLPNIDFLAREAGMSLSKFKKCFKEIYGYPPYVYHLNQKLEVAKQYLFHNKWTISEVASLLGYTSIANFDKAFKKRFKTTPTAMQKETWKITAT